MIMLTVCAVGTPETV